MIEVKLGIINFNTGNISISQNLFEKYISNISTEELLTF